MREMLLYYHIIIFLGYQGLVIDIRYAISINITFNQDVKIHSFTSDVKILNYLIATNIGV